MIAMTIDCEQWSAPLLRRKIDSANDSTEYSKKGNDNLLEILEKYGINATFFVTGFFAEKESDHVKKISKKHEIASHGYNHFYRGNNKLNLHEDISKSKEIIERIVGKKIDGFRSPQAQFSKELIKSLEKNEFKYDSSIHSAWLPGFYNHRDKPLKPFKIGNILEIPASASHNLRLPFSWIFMRNLPLVYTTKVVKKLIRRGIIPVIFLHSWEFHNFKSKTVPFYITRNVGDKFSRKFGRFLEEFKNEKFVTMKEIYKRFMQNQS
jgi:hypothetical protein